MRSDPAIQNIYVNEHVYVVVPRWHVFKYTEATLFFTFVNLLEVHI